MSDDLGHTDPSSNSTPGQASGLVGASWQEQDGVLRELWMQNKTPQEIGDVLGRSIPAIMTRAARLGLPRRSAPGRKPGVATTRRLPPVETSRSMPRQRDVADNSEAYAFPASQAGLRVCLMCLRKFESNGRHNRICAPCKGTAEYSQASSLPDIQLPSG
jgi:hypothetical protein